MEDDEPLVAKNFSRQDLLTTDSNKHLHELVAALRHDVNVGPTDEINVSMDVIMNNISILSDHDVMTLLGRVLVSESQPIQVKQLLLTRVYNDLTARVAEEPRRVRRHNHRNVSPPPSITVSKDSNNNSVVKIDPITNYPPINNKHTCLIV